MINFDVKAATRSAWRPSAKVRLRSLLIVAFCLTSCATPYQQAGFLGGYKDLRIDSNTASVTFTGNADTPRQRVEAYLLYRCAEVTRDSGYDYFVIVDQFTESRFSYAPGFYTANTYSSVSGGPRSATGQSTTTGTYFPGFMSTEYAAQAMIKMFEGKKPAESAVAYDARDVIEHLGPEVLSGSS